MLNKLVGILLILMSITSFALADSFYVNGVFHLESLEQDLNGGGYDISNLGTVAATTQVTTPAIVATSNSLALKPTTDATTAIQLQDQDGNSILNVDTTNDRVGIGTTGPTKTFQVTAPSGENNLAYFTTNDFISTSTGSSFNIMFGAASGNTYTSLRALSTGATLWNNLVLQSGGGNVGIGATSPQTKLDQAKFSADALGSYHTFSKSRNATAGSHTVVQDNDVIGGIKFAPSDGTDFGTISAQIAAEVDDASPAASSIGGALVFSTAAGAGADDLTERMRIAASGAVSITGSGQIPYMPVLSKTADYVVTTSDFGKSIRFSHASTTGTMTLPSVGSTEDGARLTFIKSGVARLVLDASDSDLIYDSSAGGTIYSDSAYATITLEYVHGITAWVIISAVGTWTTT